MNRLSPAGVEVEPSNVGERESMKLDEGDIRIRVAMKRGDPVRPVQIDEHRVGVIPHEGGR